MAIKKQPWDESTKDTPEYDIKKIDKKIADYKKKIEKIKKEMEEKGISMATDRDDTYDLDPEHVTTINYRTHMIDITIDSAEQYSYMVDDRFQGGDFYNKEQALASAKKFIDTQWFNKKRMSAGDDEQTAIYSDKMKEIDSSKEMPDEEGPAKSNKMKPIDSSSMEEEDPQDVEVPEPRKRTPQEMMEDPTTVTDEHEETQEEEKPVEELEPGKEDGELDGDRALEKENEEPVKNANADGDEKIEKKLAVGYLPVASANYKDFEIKVFKKSGSLKEGYVWKADGAVIENNVYGSAQEAMKAAKDSIDDVLDEQHLSARLAEPSNIKDKYTSGHAGESYTVYQTTNNKWYSKTSVANEVLGPFPTEERAELAAKSMIDDLEPLGKRNLTGENMNGDKKLSFKDISIEHMNVNDIKLLWDDLTIGETEPVKAAITKLSTHVENPEEFVNSIVVRLAEISLSPELTAYIRSQASKYYGAPAEAAAERILDSVPPKLEKEVNQLFKKNANKLLKQVMGMIGG